MSEIPVQVVVAAFQDEGTANEVLRELRLAKWAGLIGIQNAAVIRRDKKDKVHIKELRDWGGGKGAAVGGAIGAVAGALLGPGALLTGAAGAAIGGLAAKLRDSGFSNDRLNTIGESLTPGSSAIVAVIEHKWVDELEKEMAEAGADVVTATIAADIAGQLQAGREVAFSAIGDEESLEVSRTSVGEEDMEVSRIGISEEGVVAGEAVATKEGLAGQRIVATDEYITYEIASASKEGLAYAETVLTEDGEVTAALLATPDEEADAETEAEA
ncbi:MAG: DUF1269 domain-containing protein [Anaerolineae bacterium]|jgi:uncharacterized membrane protein